MTKNGMMMITDYSENELLTLHEVCMVCHISENTLQSLIEYEIIHPDKKGNEVKLNIRELKRIEKAKRLQRDLEVNLSGIAVILDLLEKLDEMEHRLAVFHKHYNL